MGDVFLKAPPDLQGVEMSKLRQPHACCGSWVWSGLLGPWWRVGGLEWGGKGGISIV